jgi:hypothetical protein
MEKIEMLRQSGKTTRIANFVIDQLHSVGEVIVTDHTSFEFSDIDNMSSIRNLIEKVEKLDAANSPGNRRIGFQIFDAQNTKLIRFRMNKTLNL